MPSIRIEYLKYELIEKNANEFLKRYNPQRKIPVPIENIIEITLKIKIIPVPDLRKIHQIDGYTSHNRKEITVDQLDLEKIPNRYRFTLGHEAGHIFLHRDIFEELTINTISDWKEFVSSIPEKDYSRLEYQAYCFAGLVLVPKLELSKEIHTLHNLLIAKNFDIESNKDLVWEIIYEGLATKFMVSKDVIMKRIQKENLQEIF
jgi:Zn-dependent peptidase ImmA (M78 family)